MTRRKGRRPYSYRGPFDGSVRPRRHGRAMHRAIQRHRLRLMIPAFQRSLSALANLSTGRIRSRADLIQE
jgi:hypothetical protein